MRFRFAEFIIQRVAKARDRDGKQKKSGNKRTMYYTVDLQAVKVFRQNTEDIG